MQRKSLLVAVLAVLIAGVASFTIAQDAPPAAAAAAAKGPLLGHADGPGFKGGPGFDHPGFDHHGFDGLDSPVISDLRELEHLYMMSGRGKELPALYNDVLAKSQDPRVRTYVYHRLAHAQAAPANPDQAIATLRKSLDENLANEAKQRAEFDQMRSEWEQRRSQAKPAPAPQP